MEIVDQNSHVIVALTLYEARVIARSARRACASLLLDNGDRGVWSDLIAGLEYLVPPEDIFYLDR